MRSTSPGLLLIVLLSADLAAMAQSPTTLSRPGQIPAGGVTGPRDRPKLTTGTAIIRGIVIGGEDGAPLRRALVRAVGGPLQEPRATITDEQGRWELTELPPGRYSLSAMKAGYVPLEYGQRRPLESGRPVDLSEGQVVSDVAFNLSRGSVISGRVVDEFGDPLIDVTVAPLRYRYVNGRRRLFPAGRFANTDDGGNFRLFELPPGEYYVTATLQDAWRSESDNHSGYGPTYYPGTASVQQAEKITLGVAAEVSGIVVSLVPVRTASISGTAMNARGQPMTGGFVSLIEGSPADGAFSLFGGNSEVRADGTFTIRNVPPGEYTLIAAERDQGDTSERAFLPVTMSGADVAGVSVIANRAATIEGQVVLDVQPRAGTVKASEFGVYAMPKNPSAALFQFGFTGADRINDDWTFELRAAAGPILLRTSRMPTDYSLKSVFWRGEDVTDSGIPFRSGEAITGVELVVKARTSTITGAVSGADGKPTADYIAIIFTEDSDRWTWLSRHIAVCRPDQQGAFAVNGLPAGRYLAAAVPFVEEGEEQSPETLERLRVVATPFTLTEGERKDLRLTLVEY